MWRLVIASLVTTEKHTHFFAQANPSGRFTHGKLEEDQPGKCFQRGLPTPTEARSNAENEPRMGWGGVKTCSTRTLPFTPFGPYENMGSQSLRAKSKPLSLTLFGFEPNNGFLNKACARGRMRWGIISRMRTILWPALPQQKPQTKKRS